ncbi:MAG: PHP domain-containing protein, partial [Bacteroidia bacterium]|nr:PHP domain-containing protein [Bacteroidia bacterium]
MFLIFDTETTGLPRDYNAPVTDLDNWPRCVQVAWQLHDESGKLISHNSIIIRPDGYTIPFKAVEIHGISTERALQEGADLKESLLEFAEALQHTKYLCGHNIEFDINIIGAEFIRSGMSDLFAGKAILDTKSDSTTEFCAIPGGKGGKFKWPTLTELYTKLFNQSFEEAHNAAFDVNATARCFFEVVKRGIMKVPGLAKEIATVITYDAPDLSVLLAHEKNLKKSAFDKAQSDKKETSNENVSEKKETKIDTGILFSHLHTHSQFSVLQSTSDVDDLVKKAASYNCPGLAISDHGNMFGAFLFWQSVDKHNKKIKDHNALVDKGEKQEEKKSELKCIIGCELFVTDNRASKDKQ